jgi:hypothetical protein
VNHENPSIVSVAAAKAPPKKTPTKQPPPVKAPPSPTIAPPNQSPPPAIAPTPPPTQPPVPPPTQPPEPIVKSWKGKYVLIFVLHMCLTFRFRSRS